MLLEPLASILLVIDAFEKLGIPYMIGGSLASAFHGTAKSTLDTDIIEMLKMGIYIKAQAGSLY